MYRPINHGYIEVVIGPMYSGKSEELIRRLKRAKIAKQNVKRYKEIIAKNKSLKIVENDTIGEEVVEKYGEDKLKEIAKFNFKNTDRILHTLIY